MTLEAKGASLYRATHSAKNEPRLPVTALPLHVADTIPAHTLCVGRLN